MADWEGKDRRIAALMDRRALGEALTAEELALCDRAAEHDPHWRREIELYDELALLDVAPDAASRALVDATLARLAQEQHALAEAELSRDEDLARLRRPARVRLVIWISGAAAAAAAIALVLLAGSREQPRALTPPLPSPRVELVYAAGDVRVDGKPVAFGATLLTEGSEIHVGAGSACIAMDPDIDLCTTENTRLLLAGMHGPWRRVDLLAGKLAVQLSPQPEGHRLSIVADDVWATALGTAFTVERGERRGVRTTVLHGKVRVGSDGGDEQIVGEHQRAEVRGKNATVAPISRSDESPEWALLRPSRLWSNPVSATLALRGLPAGTEVLLDGQVIGSSPISTLIPAGMHRLSVRIDGQIVATREFVSEVGQLTAISFEGQQLGARTVQPPAPAPAPAPQKVARTPRRSKPAAPAAEAVVEVAPERAVVPAAAELLADARRLLRAGSFDEAAGRYRALREAYPQSAEAQTVVVPLAELELDRLGRPERALASLEPYLRDGRGALLEEARLVRIRALRRLDRSAREADAIAEFLREHPRSFKAAALERRLSELQE